MLKWLEFRLYNLIYFYVSFGVVRDLSAYPNIRVIDNSYVIVSWSNRLCKRGAGVRDKAKYQQSISEPKDVYSLSRLLFST